MRAIRAILVIGLLTLGAIKLAEKVDKYLTGQAKSPTGQGMQVAMNGTGIPCTTGPR